MEIKTGFEGIRKVAVYKEKGSMSDYGGGVMCPECVLILYVIFLPFFLNFLKRFV